mmetsp:Transcript_11076/g.11162  ORF Transcript_11076/g.11162 Transcript_11076/m.11162 type:complete len:95 (-) Transcript_11076:906-1190(-)
MLNLRYEHDGEDFNIGDKVLQFDPALPSLVLKREFIHLSERKVLLLYDVREVSVKDYGLVFILEKGHFLLDSFLEGLVLDEDVFIVVNKEKPED